VKHSLSVKQEKSAKMFIPQTIHNQGSFMPASKFLRPPAPLNQPTVNSGQIRLIDHINSPPKPTKDGVPVQLISGLHGKQINGRPHLDDDVELKKHKNHVQASEILN
jgi:hypothetical protein